MIYGQLEFPESQALVDIRSFTPVTPKARTTYCSDVGHKQAKATPGRLLPDDAFRVPGFAN
jgi:hypothetical protein